ncbi:MAG: T9SS type A sorting domain-containing protein [Dysgonamonadaceae bacterium]|jgi:hypothetical protein|nr:T9SS type A sorting domain-containing protein [Dysgonamonadaceae bacterium]
MKTKRFILLCIGTVLFLSSRAQVLKAPADLAYGIMSIIGENDYDWDKNSKIFLDFIHPNYKNINQLFANDNSSQRVPQLYTVDETDQKNAMHYVRIGDYLTQIPLGIKTMIDYFGTYRLTFDNARNLGLESFYLIDQTTGISTDLFLNTTYTFEYTGGDLGARFILLIGKQMVMADSLTVAADTPNIVDVLANDHLGTCTADNPGTVTIENSPLHGTVTVLADATLKYTPNTGWRGVDSLVYKLQNCLGMAGSAKVYLLTHKPLVKRNVACPGADVTLGFETISGVEYYWYDAQTGGTKVKTTASDTLHIVKGSSQDIGVWWVEAVAGDITFSRDPIALEASDDCGATAPTGCAATGTLLFREDFGGNETTDPIVSSTPYPNNSYSFCSQGTFTDVQSCVKGSNHYGISKLSFNFGNDATGIWYSDIDDHTYPSDDSRGYFMFINARNDALQIFQKQIDNLCGGTELTFSAWMVSAVKTKVQWVDVSRLVFQLEDLSGNVLAKFYTGVIPDSDPAWKQYGFKFTVPDGTSSVICRVINDCTGVSGADFMIDDIEVRFCAPAVDVTPVTGNFFCPGDNIVLTADYTDDGTFAAGYVVKWLYSASGSLTSFDSWSIIASGDRLETPGTTGYYRAIVGTEDNLSARRFNCCAISDPIYLASSNKALYWNPAATNNNWNDPDNWLDASGQPAHLVPGSCSTAHIPGNAATFPALDESSSPRGVYGDPTCDTIVFHFGAEIAKPQYLHYDKALVQYNFGYYNDAHVLQTTYDAHSAIPMKRQQWYALAAPLKKIVTGDFSFGGYPYTWQRGFKTSRDRSSDLSGSWYDPEANVALEIGARQNYAISLYIPEYNAATTGVNDHHHLDNLHGIIELPYFENARIAADHPMHSYSGGVSRIHYYDINFQKIEDMFDNITRGNEAYRFIFENESNQPQTNFQVTIPVVDDGNGDPQEVMVANPFISSFDFAAFYAANSSKVEEWYRLYSNGAFNTYIPSIDPAPIAPMQAFFIKPKGTLGSDIQLTFNADNQSVNRTIPLQLKSTCETGALPKGVLKICASNNDGSTWIIMDFVRPATANINRMFATDKENAPRVPQLYSVDELNYKNTLQFAPNGSEVPLGIRTGSAGHFQLSFENALNSGVESLYLRDKRNPQTLVNLFTTDTYRFDCDDAEDLADRFTLLVGKQAVGVDQLAETGDLRVYLAGNMLSVVSNQLIGSVGILSIHGVQVIAAETVNASHFEKQLTLPKGVYLVKVKLADGKTFVEKIIVR